MSNKTIYVDCRTSSSSELYDFCLNSPNNKTKSVKYIVLVNKNMSDHLLPRVGNVEFARETSALNYLNPSNAISEAKRFLLQEEAEALMSKVKEKTEEVKVKATKKKKESAPIQEVELEQEVDSPLEAESLDEQVSSDQVEDQPDEASGQSSDDEGSNFSSEF